MAIRTPLFYSSGNLQQLTSAQILQIQTRMFWLYVTNPSVSLTVSSGGGNLTTMYDTRYQAGTYVTNVSSFQPATNISVISVGFNNILKTVSSYSAPSDTNNVAFPVYYNTSGNLQSMTLQDMYDTFSVPTINNLIAGGAVYTISTSTTLSGYTLVSNTPVFTDTIPNTGAYTSGNIPNTQDQPSTVTNYYLFIRNVATTSYTVPVTFNNSGNIQTISSSSFDSILTSVIQYTAQSVTGYRIQYGINTAGNTCGTVMTDTNLDGTQSYLTNQVNADDYRSQNVPTGSTVVINNYTLNVTTY